MKLCKWILDELEDIPVEMLTDMAERGFLKPLLINDGHIIGVEEVSRDDYAECALHFE